MFLALLAVAGSFSAHADRWDRYWSLDIGVASSDILIQGVSFGLVLDPRVAITPAISIGSRNVFNFSTDETTNIVALETLAYIRWNFLRWGTPERPFNAFAQTGAGLIAAYRGDSPRMTRGSVLADVTAGANIPLGERWHVEPALRVGYPIIMGATLTAGIRFPIRERTRTEISEVIRTIPPVEIVRRIAIAQSEFIIFGPDISAFNYGIDEDAIALNDLIINYTAETLRENPRYVVRIEGHANPLTYTPSQVAALVALSEERANEVAAILRNMGVPDEQIAVAASHGGTRIAARDFDHRNMNRRVELLIKEIIE